MDSSSSIRAIAILVVAALTALWLGVSIATDQQQTLLIGIAVSGGIFCVLLGRKIWLLMMFMLPTSVPLIRGIDTKELGQILFVAMTCALFLLRRLELNKRFTEMDFWRLMVALMVFQVYARAPAGLNMFGSQVVGAKPYVIAALALIAGFALSRFRVTVGEIRWALWLTIIGSVINFPLSWLRGKFMGIGSIKMTQAVESVGGIDEMGASRITRFKTIAEIIARVVVWRISPLKSAIHPFWGFLVLLSIAFAAASGFRNSVAWVGLLYIVGIYYWGGLLQVSIAAVMFSVFLVILAFVNSAFPLPPNIQRALSPLPGTWDTTLVDDAENSTDWRVEMWIEALTSERWIKNKVFGDGLGFTREQLRQIQDLKERGLQQSTIGLTNQQESMLITGTYHSGPVQTIRGIGYVGLGVLMLALVRMAVYAHRLIVRCRNSEWWTLSLFFSVPIIIFPLFWAAVFGTFQEALAFFFIYSGLLDLLHKNLPVPEAVKARRHSYIPMAARQASPLPSGS